MKTKFLLFPALFICFYLMNSCSNEKTKVSSSDQKYPVKDSIILDVESDELVYYLFPSPNEIFERLYLTDIEYNPHITSPIENIDKFLTFRSKALNLGVYITDLAYSTIFERQSNAISYLENIQVLVTEVNISSSVFESMITRSQENITSRDSLMNISNDIFPEIIEFLEDSEMRSTIALISAGAYIEAMYIALNSVDNYSEKNSALNQIAELKFPMNNLLEQAHSTSNDPNVKSIEIYLLEINNIFKGFAKDISKSKVLKDSSDEITLFGGEEIIMDEKSFFQLKERINEIRKNITKN